MALPFGCVLAGAVDRQVAATSPLDLDALFPATRNQRDQQEQPERLEELARLENSWELEIGFGKGRYLLARAAAEPKGKFMGIELAAKYFRLAVGRGRRRGLGNVAFFRGDALFLLSTLLPRDFASAVHVYFPDPWPKARHHRRRLFDPVTVDLVLGALRVGGRLFFATDHDEYGQAVTEVLESHPGLAVSHIDDPWPDGARTNYERKYLLEGRPIVRLCAERLPAESAHAADSANPVNSDNTDLLHPAGRRGIVGHE